MATHVRTVAAVTTSMGKSDRPHPVSERDERRRKALASEAPILGAKCPEAQAQLFDFSVQLRETAHVEIAGLQAAAEEVFSCVQRELRVRESPLDAAAAFELANALRWARRALDYLLGGIPAKKLEMRLSDDAPLTICMGSRKLQPVQTSSVGVVFIPVYGSGCRRICRDATRTTGGRMWRDWCPDCTPSRKKRGRSLKRLHHNVVEQMQSAFVARRSGRP